jgi:hypothetical protein
MKLISLSLGFIIFISLGAKAQGCSDSGFCTMGALKPDQFYVKKFTIRLNSIELTQHIGHTKYGDWIHSTFLDANVGLTKRTNLQIRFPAYTIIEGKMPTSSGWGDLFFNLSQNVVAKDKYQFNVTAGVKLYTSRPDKRSDDGLPMPLYQQTSYGSNDINFGASLSTRQWMFTIGYQHALNQIKNQFTVKQWEGHSLYNVVKVYDQSAGLVRGDDLMLRIERNFRLSRFNVYVGALQLWRLSPDKTVSESGTLTDASGSNGLAANLVLGGGYQFGTHMGIRLLTSLKIKERNANPDGLSRDFIGQVAYIVRF